MKSTTKLAWYIPLVLATFLAANVVHASGLPRYDVQSHCNDVSDVSGGSLMIRNGCIDMEQTAYDELKPVWASIPSRIRNYCDEVARVTGGSYSILQGCIDMENEAAGSARQFKY